MKQVFLAIITAVFGLSHHSSVAQDPVTLQWAKCYGSSGDEVAKDVIQTPDNGYLVLGSTQNLSALGQVEDGDVSGNHFNLIADQYLMDYWLLKLDAAGEPQWQRCFGGTQDEEPYAMTQASDGGFVLVGSARSADGDVTSSSGSSDFWVVKVDYTGNLEWERTYGGSDEDEAWDVIPASNGGYIVVGHARSTDGDVIAQHTYGEFWILKLDEQGAMQWQRTYGGTLWDEAHAVTATTDGGYVVAGLTQSDDGDISGSHGNYESWVIKIDVNGDLLWQKALGGSIRDIAHDVKATPDGGCIVLAESDSNDGDVSEPSAGGVWVVKLNASGGLEWERSYGAGSASSYGTSIAPVEGGGYVFAAKIELGANTLGGHDYWVVAIDQDGTMQWNQHFGGGAEDIPNAIKVTADMGFVVVGGTSSSDFMVPDNHGDHDYYVVKLGRNYNSIIGRVFADMNGNSGQDNGEPALHNFPVIGNGDEAMTLTGPSGAYDLFVFGPGTYQVAPSYLAHYEPVPVSHTAVLAGPGQTSVGNDFALQPIGSAEDLAVFISPATFFRPGFNAELEIHFRNVGTTSIAPTVVYFKDPLLIFISASITPDQISADSLVWQLPLLQPLEEGTISVNVEVSFFVPVGTIIPAEAKVFPVVYDAVPADNSAHWPVHVTGSFDPNDITVDRTELEADELVGPAALEYLIRFQNTGNDTAFTVSIASPLPSSVVRSSFQLISSSHPVELEFSNETSTMWFNFNNILLPDSNTNEEESHGSVRYRINASDALLLGDLILSSASIFFDFNAPVETNTAQTIIVENVGLGEEPSAVPFSVFPNPTDGL